MSAAAAAMLYVLAGVFCWTLGLLTSIRSDARRLYLRLLPRYVPPWLLLALLVARTPAPLWLTCGLALAFGVAAAFLACERTYEMLKR